MRSSTNNGARLARTVGVYVLTTVMLVLWIAAIWHTGPGGKRLGQTGALLLIPLLPLVFTKGILDHRWFDGW